MQELMSACRSTGEEMLLACRVATELRLVLERIERGRSVSEAEIESADGALADFERARAASDAALVAALQT